MKKNIILLLSIVALVAFTGCSQPKPVKTIENLKAGIKGETTASAKYLAFAEKARMEGYLKLLPSLNPSMQPIIPKYWNLLEKR